MLCGWLASLSLNAQEAPAAANALAASPSLSGYVSTTYHLERGAGNRNYRNADSVGSGWSLDHVALSLHLPLNEWLFDAGYRIDAWLGPDASLLESGSSSDNTVELRQAYIDFRIPLADPRNGDARSIDLRAGLFDNPFGYESLDRNLNPHHTHSWGFTIEPTLHTGLLLMYPGVDVLENGEADYLLTLGTANTTDLETNAAAENDNRKTWIFWSHDDITRFSRSLGRHRLLRRLHQRPRTHRGGAHSKYLPRPWLALAAGRLVGSGWCTMRACMAAWK